MTSTRHADHTDSVPRKLELLKSAYDAGHFDIAMSLAESIKDTLQFEQQARGAGDEPQISATTFVPVSQLPPASWRSAAKTDRRANQNAGVRWFRAGRGPR